MITYSITYEIITEESAQYGEAEERGFEVKEEKCDFRELVEMLETHPHPSCSDIKQARWFTSEEEVCMWSGDTKLTSIHIGEDAVSKRAWRRALKHLGRL